MERLNRTTVKNLQTQPLKIIQFGGGNFLRAFVDWMVQVLNDQTDFNAGIAIIKPTEGGDYQKLKRQDGLFTVVLDGIKEGEFIAHKQLVSAVQEIINPYQEWQKYLELAEEADLRFIVSNTTEAGIKFNPTDTVSDAPPKEFPAKLTLWLYRRYTHFKADPLKGCILLPCELIEGNGATLKNTILEYADHWSLKEGFKNWVITSNHFCNTLVDRIVSGYPSNRADKIKNEIRFDDELLVAGEYYHSWIIEAPELVEKELPFSKTDLNVLFVDDLAPYREMKVRILNGAHTAMVPVGYLSGLRLVAEIMDDVAVRGFIESLLLTETIKTLDFSETTKHKFVQDVLDRFRNPLLKHQLISISLNSSSKFATRLLPTLKDYLALEKKLPAHIVFAFSALILYYRGTWNGEKIDLKDDKNVLDFFHVQWNSVAENKISLSEMVPAVLGNTELWREDLTLIHGLSEQVAYFIKTIQAQGIRESLKAIQSTRGRL